MTTAADRLDQIIHLIERGFSPDLPDSHRAVGLANGIAAAVVTQAAALIEEHNFEVAYDLIVMGSAAVKSMHTKALENPQFAEVARGLLAKSLGAEPFCLGTLQGPNDNALSDAEMTELGLERESDEGYPDPHLVIFHAWQNSASKICVECGASACMLQVEICLDDLEGLGAAPLCEEHGRASMIAFIESKRLAQVGDVGTFYDAALVKRALGAAETDEGAV